MDLALGYTEMMTVPAPKAGEFWHSLMHRVGHGNYRFLLTSSYAECLKERDRWLDMSTYRPDDLVIWAFKNFGDGLYGEDDVGTEEFKRVV